MRPLKFERPLIGYVLNVEAKKIRDASYGQKIPSCSALLKFNHVSKLCPDGILQRGKSTFALALQSIKLQ